MYAQHTISRIVKNSVTRADPGCVVTVKGSSDGDFTNDNGNFKFKTQKNFPLTLVFSSIGYESKKLQVSDGKVAITVELNPASALGQDIVVSTSRSTQKKLESPVTIEHRQQRHYQFSQLNYYDMMRD